MDNGRVLSAAEEDILIWALQAEQTKGRYLVDNTQAGESAALTRDELITLGPKDIAYDYGRDVYLTDLGRKFTEVLQAA